MNQKILIVFTVFLLITILLLLFFSDAKSRSKRIRIMVYISGDPIEQATRDNIDSLLEKIGSENNFAFTLSDESGQAGLRMPDSGAILLQFQPNAFMEEKNELNEMQPFHDRINPVREAEGSGFRNSFSNQSPVWIDPVRTHIIYAAAGPAATRCNDPAFMSLVRDTILQVALLHKIS
jgi:hypothetical protein